MSLDKKLVDKLVNITSSASIACYKFIGKNDKISADKAATDEMRKIKFVGYRWKGCYWRRRARQSTYALYR